MLEILQSRFYTWELCLQVKSLYMEMLAFLGGKEAKSRTQLIYSEHDLDTNFECKICFVGSLW